MKKAAILAGARPQFIKAAALYRALQPVCQPVLIHTGQHTGRQLSDDFFAELQLPRPDWTLTPQGHTPEERLGGMIGQLMPVLQKEKPDCVLVIGDTDSTLAGALCAARGGFFLVHVEAGLRCGVPAMREEQNRVVADHLAQQLFALPGKQRNRPSGKAGRKSRGNRDLTVCCVEQMVKTLQETGNDQMVLNRYGVFPKKYLLFTMHRAESEENHALPCSRPSKNCARCRYRYCSRCIPACSLIAKSWKAGLIAGGSVFCRRCRTTRCCRCFCTPSAASPIPARCKRKAGWCKRPVSPCVARPNGPRLWRVAGTNCVRRRFTGWRRWFWRQDPKRGKEPPSWGAAMSGHAW